jgi:hypothetical protein
MQIVFLRKGPFIKSKVQDTRTEPHLQNNVFLQKGHLDAVISVALQILPNK